MAVTGDTPNIAARLQGYAPINGIVVSPTTWKLCAGVAEFKTLGERELKGLSEPMQLYQATQPAVTALSHPTKADHQLVLGRDHEISKLLTYWHGTESTQPRAVFVSGAAGIGKSQLVQAFLNCLQDSEYGQIECRCSTLRLQSPFYPVIELLERIFQLQPGDSSDTRLEKTVAALDSQGLEKSKLIPLLAPLLSLATDSAYPLPELPPEQLRAMTVEALIQCMLLGQNNKQTLIIFEDLHWVDPSTRDVITRLLAFETEHPLFILCTARPEFSVPWPASSSVMHLLIAQLSADDSRKIIQALDAENTLHDDIIEYIVEKTDGVPLFVEELAKSLLEAQAQGELPERGSSERLNTTLIPATLQDSLLARLDRLGTAKKSAQLGATIGREFFYRILQKSSQLEAAELGAHLDIILSAGLIFEKGESPDNRHVFKHALVQEAAYGMLIKSERQTLHQRIATVIEEDTLQSGVEQPEVLAHHHLEAGNTEAAIRYLHRAGERAVERHAVAEAIE
jgi:predicted ATPase